MFNNDKKALIIQVNEDIELKQVELSDAPELNSIIDINREYFKHWLPFVNYTVDVQSSEDVVITMVNVANMEPQYVFAIKYRGLYAGLIAFRNMDKINRKVDMGYFLSEPFHKRGIVFQSVLAMMDHAFKEMNMNKVVLRCPIGNYASSNIPRRIGFQLEGIERAAEMMPDETFIDLEVYSMLKKDYECIRWQ